MMESKLRLEETEDKRDESSKKEAQLMNGLQVPVRQQGCSSRDLIELTIGGGGQKIRCLKSRFGN